MLFYIKILGDLRYSINEELQRMTIHHKKLNLNLFYINAVDSWDFHEIKRFNDGIKL